MKEFNVSIAIHGGSGAKPGHDYGATVENMRSLVEAGRDKLQRGAQAVEVVVHIVEELEASGLYIAGRGASPNRGGEYELDACVMDGRTGASGAVVALSGFANPIRVAFAVMKETSHVLLAGKGAAEFARSQKFEAISYPDRWFTNACAFEDNAPANSSGTVGCVARDISGSLAAATSTGGVFGKLPGRVGDSGLVGAGTWADERVAISCTGQGEYFIRSAAAAQIAHRVRFGGQALEDAASAVIREIARLGGHGGLVGIDWHGNVVMPFVSPGMKRAALLRDGEIVSLAP